MPEAERYRPDGRAAVMIDLAAGLRTRIVVAIVVSGGIGLLGIWCALTGRVAGGARIATIVALVVSVLLLTLALGSAALWRVLTRPRALVVDGTGVRWLDPRGGPWAVHWSELAAISVSRTVNRSPRRVVPSAMVRLDLFPADPGFRQRHPELERLWEFHRVRRGYRIPLGEIPDSWRVVERLDEGLRRYGGPRYRGVCDEGFTVGLF
ncbi:hypothetical protein [Nocardia rhizosphaerae]|uniref:PH (Pleckstrin Homology) domain-containing protein n=1 Tax=Nocardia rhizosphaerae TaxID=1691571 RepID=A0ABV8LCH5_9NOCA